MISLPAGRARGNTERTAAGPEQTRRRTGARTEKPLEKKIEPPPEAKAGHCQAAVPPKVAKSRRKKAKAEEMARLAQRPEFGRHQRGAGRSPPSGANSQNPNAPPNWRSQLCRATRTQQAVSARSTITRRTRRCPTRLLVDRSGGVHNVRIVRSSGSSLLDRATLALVARAAPLPPPRRKLPAPRSRSWCRSVTTCASCASISRLSGRPAPQLIV